MLAARLVARTSIRTSTTAVLASAKANPAVRGFATVYFTKTHEYAKIEGEEATVGITDYAQKALGDLVYVEMPNVGDKFKAGDVFGTCESVKAASDLYAPVSGTVLEVNSELSANPALVNQDPHGKGWMCKLKLSNVGETKTLLSEDAYKKTLH